MAKIATSLMEISTKRNEFKNFKPQQHAANTKAECAKAFTQNYSVDMVQGVFSLMKHVHLVKFIASNMLHRSAS